MKPRLYATGVLVQSKYEQIAALPDETPITFCGYPAEFVGMTGDLITIRMKRRIGYLRKGMPEIEEITW